MTAPLDEVCCARLPRAALAGLADLRTAPAVTVLDANEECVWVRWPAGDEAVLRHILPLAGVELFRTHAGLWFRADELLPTPGPPVGEGRRLDRILHPAPFQAAAPPDAVGPPVRLRLKRDDRPRSATALRCPLAVLAAWADTALTREIVALRGAWVKQNARDAEIAVTERVAGAERLSEAPGVTPKKGDPISAPPGLREYTQPRPPLPGVRSHPDRWALLVGDPLPWLADGERFWGRRILTPLGWRPEPALPESTLTAALGLEAESLAILHADGFTLVGEAALQPLTRGAIRRATADLHGE